MLLKLTMDLEALKSKKSIKQLRVSPCSLPCYKKSHGGLGSLHVWVYRVKAEAPDRLHGCLSAQGSKVAPTVAFCALNEALQVDRPQPGGLP